MQRYHEEQSARSKCARLSSLEYYRLKTPSTYVAVVAQGHFKISKGKSFCFACLAVIMAGVLRGNTIRGNTTRNFEENGTLRGSLRGSLKNLWKPLKTSENL